MPCLSPACCPGPYVLHLTLQHFFDAERVHFRAFVGWMVVLANLINSLAASLYLMFVVRCPDASADPHMHCMSRSL